MNEDHASPEFRTFELPPEGFDPTTAEPEALRRYGFPRRPDPNAEPELARLFHRVFAHPWTYIQPELTVDATLEKMTARHRGQQEFTSGDWGGAVATMPGGDPPPNLVLAQFVAPQVIGFDPEVTADLIIGFWIGLGGYAGSDSLLQAGIAATVTPNPLLPGIGSVSYWAWTEWFPAGYRVDNLELISGDLISVLVCAPEPDHGFVMMGNHRTNQIVSIGVTAPSGVTANGRTAEWIIEALSNDTPIFTPITFFNCAAANANDKLTLTGATTLNMPGPMGNEIKTTILSPSSVILQWEAFQ